MMKLMMALEDLPFNENGFPEPYTSSQIYWEIAFNVAVYNLKLNSSILAKLLKIPKTRVTSFK